MSSKTADTTTIRTTRKKAVRHVPSRYMQAAQVSKSSSAESASVNTTTSLNSNETLDTSQAPWLQQDGSSGNRFASTPNSSGDGFSFPLHDASVIAGNTTHSAPTCKEHLIAASALKQRPKFQSETGNLRPSHGPVGAVIASRTGKEKSTAAKVCSPDLIRELEIKNMYAMHVQAAFLESRARKCFQMRAQNALEQFYKVCCVIQIFMQQLTSTENTLLFVNHMQLIQKLKPQEDTLEVVSNDMTALFECYCEISNAIDFVRSNLPLSDVHVAPDSNLRADLSCLLAKCEAQLESFLKSHSSEIIEFSSLSKLLIKIKSCIGDLEKETYKLNDLLLAVDEMAVTESSLKIGEITSTVVNDYVI